MRIIPALGLFMALAIVASPASGQDKAASKLETSFAAVSGDFVARSFPDATEEDKATIFACLLEATAVLDGETRAVLVDYGFDSVPFEQQQAMESRYPDLMDTVRACPPRSALLTLRNVKVHGGPLGFSVGYGGQGSLPSYAGGVYYDAGTLSVGGTVVELPDFEQNLVVEIAEDGTVTFAADR